ncbi:MAG: SH3 domain-containing protein [Lachnospiraceae bacterium]|nr:SH3 domain-containing protein [Lachnospiraceae bacterium]
MKKLIVLVCTVATTIFVIIGCNSGSVTSDFMDKLEEHARHNTSYIKTEQQSSQINMEAVIDGNEKENIVKVLANANIMNKPSEDGTIVGEVRTNESVLLIGEDNVGGWYKVAYNGRVCYVKGTNLDMQTQIVDKGDLNNGENNTPATTTRHTATTTQPGGNSEQTTTTRPGHQNQNSTTPNKGTTSSVSNREDETTSTGGQTTTKPTSGGDSETSTSSVISGEDNTSEIETTTGKSEQPSDVTEPSTSEQPSDTENPSVEQPSDTENPSSEQTSDDNGNGEAEQEPQGEES